MMMRNWSKYAYLTAGVLLIICGIMHVQGTFYSDDLHPQNPKLIALMKDTSVKMDATGIVWDLWIGFHAMYGMCLVFMGSVLVFLSISNFALLSAQHFIPLLSLATVVFFLWIGATFLINPFVISMAIIATLLLLGYLMGHWQKRTEKN